MSLRRGFGWTVVGNVTYAASQWLMLVLMARLVSPEALGEFSLAISIAGPMFMFSNLQLRTVVATVAARDFRFADYRAVRLLTAATSAAAATATALLVGSSIATVATVATFASAKLFESLSDIHYGFFQRLERLELVTRSLIVKAVGSLAAVALAASTVRTSLAASAGVLCAWAATFLLLDRSGVVALRQDADPAIEEASSRRRRYRIIANALPLGIASGLSALNVNIPRYAVYSFLGPRELGLFAAVSYLQVVGGTLVGAVGVTVTARLARHYLAGERAALLRLIRTLLATAAGIGGVALLVALLAGRWLLGAVFGPAFLAVASVLVFVLAGSALDSVSAILGYALTAFGKRLSLVSILLPVTIASTAASVLLVPRLGLNGAGAAVLCASCVQLAMTLLFFSRALRDLRRRGE